MNAVERDGDSSRERVSSGIPGFDNILGGGFPANRVHLIQGAPGTGKTTLALQFLLDGASRGEPVLYVTMAETIDELQEVAESHGWDLTGLTVRELAPDEAILRPDEEYSILHPSEVELGETIWSVLEEIERLKPSRVVFDSLNELRLLARDQLRFHRQILALKQVFAGQRCTVLLLDGAYEAASVESVAHSVVFLEQTAPEYGRERRRIRVVKLRGGRYRGGFHDLVIQTGGVVVFPRLVANEHPERRVSGLVKSGVAELDRLLGDGLHRGTSTLLIGPAGVGKSVLATQYVVAAAERGEQGTVYIFDESRNTFINRSTGLGFALNEHLESGRITLRQLDPAQLSPGEFDYLVREAVESNGSRVLVLDSLNGYLNAMSEEHLVLVQLHELLSYVGRQGVVTFITVAQHGLVGDNQQSPLDISYLADTVLLMRYFEAAGELRQAISVVKKRSGSHERSIRELKFGPGVRVGEPIREFQGVLAGSPTFVGRDRTLLANDH